MDEPSVNAALERVRTLYTEGIVKHGTASKAVGWNDEASQRLRFEKLTAVIADDERPFSVADWGCGYGAMFGFLAERFGERLDSYRGYDISSAMVEAARDNVDDARAEFVLGSEPEPVDYVFVSGTFNVRFAAGESEWQGWIEERLRELASVARRGLAFNLLSTYVDWKEDHLFYGDPRALFDFCKRELSPRVSLLHDYPLYEWTMLVQVDG